MKKPVLATDVLKRALPDRRFTDEDVANGEAWLKRLQALAGARGWTPEYVASLDKKDGEK